MEGLNCVKFLAERGDWIVKLDLQDAYFMVAINPYYRKFLRFYRKDNLYEYNYMPFCLCSAPRVFTKVLKPFVAYFRDLGIRLIIYLDDIFILSDSISGLLNDLDIAKGTLQTLGFIINLKKSVLEPRQIMELYGVIVDTRNLLYLCPMKKLVTWQKFVTKFW